MNDETKKLSKTQFIHKPNDSSQHFTTEHPFCTLLWCVTNQVCDALPAEQKSHIVQNKGVKNGKELNIKQTKQPERLSQNK